MRTFDPNKFRYSEMCAGKTARGYYHNFMDWRMAVSSIWAPAERYIGVAAYRKNDVKNKTTYGAKFTLPFFISDIDRGLDKQESYNVACRMTENLSDYNIRMDQLFVDNTGGDGFHVRMCSGTLGSPIWFKREYPKRVLGKMFAEIIDEDLDEALFNPSQICRLPGSRHNSGKWCVSYTAEEFLKRSYDSIIGDSVAGILTEDVINPYEADPCKELIDLFMSHYKTRSEVIFKGYGDVSEEFIEEGSGIISRIKKGISEGEIWWEPRNYQGRSLGMFMFSQHLLRQGHDISTAWELLVEQNKLNDPPLRVSELKGRFTSGIRSHQKKQKR